MLSWLLWLDATARGNPISAFSSPLSSVVATQPHAAPGWPGIPSDGGGGGETLSRVGSWAPPSAGRPLNHVC